MSTKKAFCDESSPVWEVAVNRNLQDWEIGEYEKMFQVLANVHLSSMEDKLNWKLGKSNVLSVNFNMRKLNCSIDILGVLLWSISPPN